MTIQLMTQVPAVACPVCPEMAGITLLQRAPKQQFILITTQAGIPYLQYIPALVDL